MKGFKNQSISLVKLDTQTNQLHITPQAIRFLQSLSNPVAVITIAGLYRTGKSFLVNKLLPSGFGTQQQATFKVGATTQSMTKGLNILATPITLHCEKTGKDIDYLLIDSEGIGSCQQSVKYDTDLLILIFLISSTVVYNSMGAIDELSLEQLQVVLKLKKCVQKTEHSYDNCSFKYTSPPPKLLWVLRDFSLQLIDENGKQLTPDQYLQRCLEQSPSHNLQSKKKNQIRRAIKQNLGERHCYTLVRPTIKEEDLQHLASIKSQQASKIRAQFIGQLQCLKQQLFSGSASDIKVINNQQITGRLFHRILVQYLNVINNNQLPKVNDVWHSVIKMNNQQFFEQSITQLKRYMKNIRLPISKQQLKMKINEIENKTYHDLQKNIANQSEFKLYHKEFLKIIQKLNKQLKERNDQHRKSTLMNQLRLFVKQNLNYEAIKPSNISQIMKQLIQRIKIKINGLEEGYEYLISIINDVFFICEQKSAKIERQFTQLKLIYDNLSLQKNNMDLTIINLKRQYHDSLKAIAKLQQGQADIDKNYMLNKNKIVSYESKISKLQNQSKQQKQMYDKNMKQLQQKLKTKIEDLSAQNKKIKRQHQQLCEQLKETKQKLCQEQLASKKKMIFQQKIQQSYEKFNQQRATLKKQIQSYKKQINNLSEKYQQLKQIYDKQVERQRTIEQNHQRKQQNLMKQFQNLKRCMKETRASYEQTYQTMQASDQVMRQVTNSTTKKQRFQTPGKQVKVQNQAQPNNMGNNNAIKKFYDAQIQKLEQQHKIKVLKLEQQIVKLQKQLSKQQNSKQMYFMQAKQYKQKCIKLESDIITANSKFSEVLKHIEDAKQQQRMLYEESIVRLLNNIQKKQRDSISSSGLQTRNSRSSTNQYRKRQKHAESITDSMSFGNAFRND